MKPQGDDLAPEYDFSRGVKGRYAGRFYVDPATPPGTTVVVRHSIPEHDLQPGDAGQLLGAADKMLAVEFTFGNRDVDYSHPEHLPAPELGPEFHAGVAGQA
jgi:hypothetical protein